MAQRWFAYQRHKQKAECSLGKDQSQEGDPSQQPTTEECLPEKGSQDQIALSPTQKKILTQAFKRNPDPNTTTRKTLGKKTCLPEQKIQMCFQNERSLVSEQSREQSGSVLVGDADEASLLLHQPPPVNPPPLPVTTAVPHFTSHSSHQTSPPGPFPTVLSFALWNPVRICVSPGSSITVLPPTLAVDGVEHPSPAPVFVSSLQAPGENITGTQASSRSQVQEKCQGDMEHAGMGVSEDSPQLHPEHEGAQAQTLGHTDTDISYIMQWWDNNREALIAEWEPYREAH
ncbi:double homeobox protein B [Ctenodactylus gundi]